MTPLCQRMTLSSETSCREDATAELDVELNRRISTSRDRKLRAIDEVLRGEESSEVSALELQRCLGLRYRSDREQELRRQRSQLSREVDALQHLLAEGNVFESDEVHVASAALSKAEATCATLRARRASATEMQRAEDDRLATLVRGLETHDALSRVCRIAIDADQTAIDSWQKTGDDERLVDACSSYQRTLASYIACARMGRLPEIPVAFDVELTVVPDVLEGLDLNMPEAPLRPGDFADIECAHTDPCASQAPLDLVALAEALASIPTLRLHPEPDFEELKHAIEHDTVAALGGCLLRNDGNRKHDTREQTAALACVADAVHRHRAQSAPRRSP